MRIHADKYAEIIVLWFPNRVYALNGRRDSLSGPQSFPFFPAIIVSLSLRLDFTLVKFVSRC